MSNFLLLTKVSFLSGFNVNRKNKNQRTAFSAFLLTIVLMLVISIAFCTAFFLPKDGIDVNYEAALTTVCFLATMMSFAMGLFQMQTVLFKTKDFELLESMPFSKSTIVWSKITSIYITNLLEDAAIVIPAIGFYIYFTNNYLIALLALVAIIFLSFAPILISTVIGLVSALVTAKSKHANIIGLIVNIVFMVALFGGYMVFIYADQSQVENAIESVFLFDWLNKAFLGNYIYYLWYILFNIGMAAVVVGITVPLYRPINSWMNSNNGHVDYEKIKNKIDTDTSLNKILLRKEWNMIYRKPNYLINSSIGSLFYLIMGALFIFGSAMFVNGEVTPEDKQEIELVFSFMVPALGLMMNSIACTASTSISFEKRIGYELLRSYPIEPKDIIKAKVKISLIIQIIMNLIVSTIIMILFMIKGMFNPALYIMVYLYPMLASINLTAISMLCGLKWPKLDYETDQQVIKNSAAANLPVLFCMLPSMIVLGGNMVFLIFGIANPVFFYISICVVSAIYIIQIIIFYALLSKKGENLFEKIIYR